MQGITITNKEKSDNNFSNGSAQFMLSANYGLTISLRHRTTKRRGTQEGRAPQTQNKTKHIMKKFVLLVSIALGLLGLTDNTSAAFVNPDAWLTTFQITAVYNSTNITVTNTTTGVKTTTGKLVTNILTSKDIIKMLSTEYSTNFPSTAVLAYRLGNGHFYVAETNGPLIMDVHPTLQLSNSVIGNFLLVQGGQTIERPASTNLVLTQFANDYLVNYSDSHGNDFHVVGALIANATASQVGTNAIYPKFNFVIPGTGGGKFISKQGTQVIGIFPKAQVNGFGKNLIP